MTSSPPNDSNPDIAESEPTDPADLVSQSKRPSERKERRITTDPKQLAAEFALAVTVQASEVDWIAKNGEESLFSTLRRIYPEVMELSF
jgi:hypothetical protein